MGAAIEGQRQIHVTREREVRGGSIEGQRQIRTSKGSVSKRVIEEQNQTQTAVVVELEKSSSTKTPKMEGE